MSQGMSVQTGVFGRIARKALSYRLTGVILALFVLVLFSGIVSPNFLSPYNIIIMLRTLAFVGLVALGQTVVLLLGELDLSVGAVAGFTAITSGLLMVQFSVSPWIAIFLGLCEGALCGFLNGLLITKLRLNALVATLGMMGVFQGLNLVVSRGKAIIGIPNSIYFLGQGSLLGVPVPAVIMILLTIMLSIVLKWTAFGRYIFAIGNNREAARLIGIKVDRIRISAFMLCSVLSSIAGILMVARLGSAQPQVGEIWQLSSIASPVIGGTALTGGLGSAFGGMIGAAIIGVIENIIILFGVSPYWQSVVSGLVVVAAISIDSIQRMVSSKE